MTEPVNNANNIAMFDPIFDLKGLRRRIMAAHSDVLKQWSGDNHNLGNDVNPDEEK